MSQGQKLIARMAGQVKVSELGGGGVLNVSRVHSNIYARAAKAVHHTLSRFIGWLRGATTRPALRNSSWLHRNGCEASCIPVCNRCRLLENFKAVLRKYTHAENIWKT